tara:strand:+ start:257 stop:1561 length:1305 start_codon:yes stop_codon:yes gene_type:complete
MPGTSVVQSGNFSLEIDTGYDWESFTLDDATRGVLDNTEFTLGPGTSYADVTDGAVSIRSMRGRQDIGDQFTYGTMTFVLNDSLAGGIFSPYDTSSPYYDPATNLPGLAPLRKVRFSRYDSSNNKEYLFVGYIVNYDYQFGAPGEQSFITVMCADYFYILAQTRMNAWSPSEELSGARYNNVLSLTEVAYPTGATYRDISTGTVTLGGSAAYDVAQGTSVATYANDINLAEQGRVFISRDGVFTTQDRLGNTLSGSVADFHDDGTAIPYNNVDISFQADQVKNYAAVTHLGATSAEIAEDAASRATYLTQSIFIDNSLVHNDAAALALAQYLIVGEPEPRFNYVGSHFAMMSNAQRDTCAIIDIGDTITVQKSIQTGATSYQLAQELSVEGIQWNVDLQRGFEFSLFTAPTTIVYELILDNATYGTLNALNVLG